VPGIDLTQVKAATVKPSDQTPASTAARGETAPPARTGEGQTTGQEPGGEPTAREKPTRDRPDRVSFTNQKPGTTQKVIEEDYVYVRMKTSAGDIVLELDRARAPITVENFLSYMKTGFYEGTIFHRVMSNSMIQGGGYTAQWERRETGPPIKCEAPNGLQNRRGAIAMARLAAPDTATSQFFINVRDNVWLDSPPRGPGYAVFGKVIAGMDVIDAIKDAPVQQSRLNRSERAEPVEPVVIEKVELTEREAVSE
jgi:peptidyl-prolyl cis-trans isomerase A (cyclophilin A)